MKSLAPGVWTASLVMAGLAAGALVGATTADDAAEVAALRDRVAALATEADEALASAARLRAERNGLEAQLAARRDATPACPTRFTSTADSGLPLPFAVEVPCGWHVVVDAVSLVERPAREGLVATVTLVSQLPIGLAPTTGALTDIQVLDWSDDPSEDGDALPTVASWLAEERTGFAGQPVEDRFEGPDGLTIHRLRGRLQLEDRLVQAVVLVWTYVDPGTGARHIVRALAEEPGARVTRALEHLARSFRLDR